MKKKVCSKCHIVVEAEACPKCQGVNFSTNWKGRIYIVDPEKSMIAKKLEHSMKGEYAIKV